MESTAWLILFTICHAFYIQQSLFLLDSINMFFVISFSFGIRIQEGRDIRDVEIQFRNLYA